MTMYRGRASVSCSGRPNCENATGSGIPVPRVCVDTPRGGREFNTLSHVRAPQIGTCRPWVVTTRSQESVVRR